MIRPLLLALALLQVPATPGASPFSRYHRSVSVPASGQACAVLDATTFAHAASFLRDLRLSSTDATGARELPYVVTLSEAQQAESEPARILNLGVRGHAIDLDLAMPSRPYTEIVLDLAGQDFLATASVTGLSAQGSRQSTYLGDFNLFDLTSQHLSRNTSISLQESTFPLLHIKLTASPAGGSAFTATPQMIRGASVPPSREAQTLHTIAIQTSNIEQRNHQTVARFRLPERIPIERVTFTLDPAFHANFSRDVLVSSRALRTPASSGDSVSGSIQRVRMTRGSREIPAGFEIEEQHLSVPAVLGANLQSAADVEVAVKNGDDPPLSIASVQLEMRQRQLCFQATPGQQVTLSYGDPELPAPVYDLARTYSPSAVTARAQLGPEELNLQWRTRPDTRPYTERHPNLLWIALLLVVGSLAFAAFHHPRTRLH